MDDPDPAVIRAKRWSAKIDAADAFIFVTPRAQPGRAAQ
jgi:NAD(P)H-dependent FMN reductase